MLYDAHFHLRQFLEAEGQSTPGAVLPRDYQGLVSCHDQADLEAVRSARACGFDNLSISFGVHPQWLVEDFFPLMVDLGERGHLAAVGECGFDFFERGGDEEEARQSGWFSRQIEWAAAWQLPMIIHLRRATHMVFRFRTALRSLPAVVFHSWPGPRNEAESILRSGIRAWFSVGTTLLWRAKKATDTLAWLGTLADPPFLLETDMPWQPTRDRAHSGPDDLGAVADRACEILGWDRDRLEDHQARQLRSIGFTSHGGRGHGKPSLADV